MQSIRCLLDRDIREALKDTLRRADSTAAIIEELPLSRGRAKADLAFVNGELCGYEIKSEADSLMRLGMQADHYASVFEFNTLVAARRHLKLARQRLPRSWGIIEAKCVDGRVELHPRRRARRNPNLCNTALVRLLWKSECIHILGKAGMRPHANAAVIDLWKQLESISTEKLCDEVRQALKHRRARVGQQQTPCGD